MREWIPFSAVQTNNTSQHTQLLRIYFSFSLTPSLPGFFCFINSFLPSLFFCFFFFFFSFLFFLLSPSEHIRR